MVMAKLENKAYNKEKQSLKAQTGQIWAQQLLTQKPAQQRFSVEQLRERLAHSQGRKGRSKCELAQLFFPTSHQGLLGQSE